MTSTFAIGTIVAISFSYCDAVSIIFIAASSVIYVFIPMTGTALGVASEVLALSATVGLVKTVFIMIFTPLVEKKIGLTSPKMAMIFGCLVGSTSGASAGFAATEPSLVPYGTMVPLSTPVPDVFCVLLCCMES